MSIKLSICIPTYNRASFLKETLDVIQTNTAGRNDVEVVISDNASQDSTEKVVLEYSNDILNLKYQKNSINIGPARNLRKVIELATGEFVWIFSDDDIMTIEGVGHLLRFLKEHSDVFYIFYSREVVDEELNTTKLGIQPGGLQEDLFFENGNELFCSCNGQMPYIIGFYSSTIINRQLWLDYSKKTGIKSNEFAWDHLLVLLNAIKYKKCAIISQTGVYARLNYRTLKPNSKVGFDDSINCFLQLIEMGYSRKQCIKSIKFFICRESKAFVIDKANNLRDDNILLFLRKRRLTRFIFYSFFWSLLSMLDQRILNRLMNISNFMSNSRFSII